MNRVFLCGRLTKPADVRMAGETKVVKYSLAVDRKVSKGEEKQTDFLNCVCFGKTADFAEKYLTKGMKIIVIGRIQTGSYLNKEGVKVYTTDIVVEEHEFAESKNGSGNPIGNADDGGFMTIDDKSSDLPF